MFVLPQWLNWFQITFLPLTTLLFALSLRRCFTRGRQQRMATLSACIWLVAGVAIAWPDLTTRVAVGLGIGRGADLILYTLALLFAASALYFYNRLHHLEGSITHLVREIAIREALLRWPETPDRERA